MGIHVFVDDVDAVVAAAEQAGATVLDRPEDKFWGDREAKVRDPFGHEWYLSTHLQDMSADEINQMAADL